MGSWTSGDDGSATVGTSSTHGLPLMILYVHCLQNEAPCWVFGTEDHDPDLRISGPQVRDKHWFHGKAGKYLKRTADNCLDIVRQDGSETATCQ